MKPTEIIVSPNVLEVLINIAVEENGEDIDSAVKEMVQDVIEAAHIFINRFEHMYFLREEKVHEFVGLIYRDEETGHKTDEVKFRLILTDGHMGIFLPTELTLDDMYDIRLVIAESQLPEFRED